MDNLPPKVHFSSTTGSCVAHRVVCQCWIIRGYSVQSSLLTVTALSVQRYMQIAHQQRCLQFKKRLLVLMWFISVMLSIPSLVFYQIKHYGCNQIYTSEVQHVAVLLTESCVGFGSFTVTACSYIFMNRKLNQAALFNNAFTTRLFTSIIVTFFVLWMPYLFFNIVTVGILNKNLEIINFYRLGFNFFISVTFINSCMNPLLYAFALGMCRKNMNLNSGSQEMTSVADA